LCPVEAHALSRSARARVNPRRDVETEMQLHIRASCVAGSTRSVYLHESNIFVNPFGVLLE
jgi:hypothetical protein